MAPSRTMPFVPDDAAVAPTQAEAGLSVDIRRIVAEHGDLTSPVDTVADGDDLFTAGLTSLGVVRVLVALEDHFDIEFPDELLSRQMFSSVASIRDAVERARQTPADFS